MKENTKDIEYAIKALQRHAKVKQNGMGNVYKMAIEALKIQVPMKPIKNQVDMIICPICLQEVDDEDYCPECGQKLLWEDEEYDSY